MFYMHNELRCTIFHLGKSGCYDISRPQSRWLFQYSACLLWGKEQLAVHEAIYVQQVNHDSSGCERQGRVNLQNAILPLLPGLPMVSKENAMYKFVFRVFACLMAVCLIFWNQEMVYIQLPVKTLFLCFLLPV